MTDRTPSVIDELPTYIEIETSNKCNRRCSWCPTGSDPTRQQQSLMSWPLLKNILGQLGSLSYNGWLALHNYNEPLLNPRLLDEVALVKQLVPLVKPSIFTNGDALTIDRLRGLAEAGVVYIRITRYPVPGEAPAQIDAHTQLLTWLRRKHLLDSYPWRIGPARQGLMAEYETGSMKIQVIAPNIETYNHRGGTVPLLSHNRGQVPCLLTTTSAAIDWHGNMKMCCNVYPNAAEHGTYIIGSLTNESFSDLWFSNRMSELRARHRRADWSMSSICQGCSHRVTASAT